MSGTTNPAGQFQPWQQMFRSGMHTSMAGESVTVTPEDLRACARAYSPAVFAAPLVVGHPQHDSPAWGWITQCRAVDGPDGTTLEALTDRVDPAFAAAVVEGRYPNRSVSLFPPSHPRNPVPGIWYPKSLGYLGGAEPAVRGMRPSDRPLVTMAGPDAGLVAVSFAQGADLVDETEAAARRMMGLPAARGTTPGKAAASFAQGADPVDEIEAAARRMMGLPAARGTTPGKAAASFAQGADAVDEIEAAARRMMGLPAAPGTTPGKAAASFAQGADAVDEIEAAARRMMGQTQR